MMLVTYVDHQSVRVALDVEHHPVIAKNTRACKPRYHLVRSDPIRPFNCLTPVKICRSNVRMAVETTFSMMTTVWGSKVMRHLTWRGFEAHLAYMMMAFNVLVQWDRMEPDATGRIHRSIAQFVL